MISFKVSDFDKVIKNYFLFLFSIIPITFIIGSAASVLNILLIDLSFIIYIITKKNFSFLKSKAIFYLLAFYIYLIFNSFISIEFNQGFLRNFGFLRFIILFVAFNYFFIDKIFFHKVLKFWLIIISIVLIDVFIESFLGTNIFGYSGKKSGYGVRIVSFFKDEPIVGSFLSGFYLILIGYLLNSLKKKDLFLVYTLIILFLFAILLTGERSSTIKTFLGLGLFLFLIKSISLKFKFILTSTIIILILITITNSWFLKIRFSHIAHTFIKKDTIYFDLYSSGLHVFKNNKVFGVGNKNYRVETCDEQKRDIKEYLCNTHPHQIYIELLSEHGILGTITIIYILFKLIFSKIISVFKTTNYLKLGTFIYMLFLFTPLLPSGSFFNNFLLTLFVINLSIFYASDEETNIFSQKKEI